jgi:ABC-type amino acid transport substrate-binding protein
MSASSVVATASALDRILERRQLRVAVKFHPPPEEGFAPEYYLDRETGRPSGLVCELMRIMAADLGVEPEWVPIEGTWQDQFDALLAGHVDLVPKPTNTPARGLIVEFAGRLMGYDVVCLVRGADGLTGIDDLNREGARIAFTAGSSNEFVARQHFPKATMVPTTKKGDILEDGDADGWVNAPIARTYLDVHPTLAALRHEDGRLVVLSSEYAHPAVRPGDQRFLNWINNWLAYHDDQGTLRHWCHDWWRSHLLS